MPPDVRQPRGAGQSSGVGEPLGVGEAPAPEAPPGIVQSSGMVQPAGMVQPPGMVQPAGMVQPSGVVKPSGVVQPPGMVQPSGMVQAQPPRGVGQRALAAWPTALNLLTAVFIAGAVLAPVVAWSGFLGPASGIYQLYHLVCHQWAFRSFFLFGPDVVMSQAALSALGVDPYTFTGSAELGWKMAFCERDLAIYLALLAVGLWFARGQALPPMSLAVYVLLITPMLVDGGTQFIGWRESTWELRLLTGLLFGVSSGWFLFPRIDAALGVESRTYAPASACVAQPRHG